MTVVLAVLAPLLIFGTVRSAFRGSALSDLSQTAEALAWGLSPLLADTVPGLDSTVTAIARRVGVRLTVMDREGTVLADSEEDPAGMENHRSRPEVIRAFRGMTGTATRYSETLGREMAYAAVPVLRGDSVSFVVRASLFLSDLDPTIRRIGADMAVIGSILLLLGLAAAWYFARSLSEPIRSMAGVMRRVKEGDFDARVAPSRIRELDGLSTDINAMVSRMRDLVRSLTGENSGREAILRSIHEGLAVVDGSGRLIASNHSFSVMACGGDPLDPDSPADHVASREFRDHIAAVLRGDSPGNRVESGSRVYAANHAPVRGTDRTVFTFGDITELDALVRIKRDFAANVSHELRTPLTSIRGYAETLLEEVPAGDRGHVETILRNTDRLIRLVEDIRVLSELEHPDRTLELAPLDVGEILEATAGRFRAQASAKNLELVVEIEGRLPAIRADRSAVEQVLSNLLENAVRYTSAGSVSVRAGVRGRLLTVVVSDTGPGIEKEHLPRIFERFYVVDRARSRERGGTGLGLSIVKHVMTLHGGWVGVTSTPGAGSAFTVAFPIDESAEELRERG